MPTIFTRGRGRCRAIDGAAAIFCSGDGAVRSAMPAVSGCGAPVCGANPTGNCKSSDSHWQAVALIVGTLLFLYTVNCGINYYASSFSSYAGLADGTYTVEELETLCSDLVKLVNESAKSGRQSYREHRSAWRAEAVTAMQAAGEQFSCLGGFYPKPKEVLVSRILSVQQLCGVYSPFTVEANYNGDMPDTTCPIPFAMSYPI